MEMETGTVEIKFDDLLGEGEFTRVCSGVFNWWQPVAIKYASSLLIPGGGDALENEYGLLSEIKNEHVVHVVGYSSTHAFLVMELCHAKLTDYLDFKGWSLSFDDRMDLLSQLNRGLLAIHQRGIVHCDIRMEHCLYTLHSSGRYCIFKITDFARARYAYVEDDAWDVFSLADRGTWAYVAPEQFWGRRYSCKADQWALGMIFHLIELRQTSAYVRDARTYFMWVRMARHFALTHTQQQPLKTIFDRLLTKSSYHRWSSAKVEQCLNKYYWNSESQFAGQ